MSTSSKLDRYRKNAGAIDESIGVQRMKGEGEPIVFKQVVPSTRLAGLGKDASAALIPLARISPDPDQPRKTIEPGPLEALAATIKKRGVLLPIRVRYTEATGGYTIVAGQRRYEAAKLAGLESIPCRIAEDGDDSALLDQMIENASRVDVPPIEQARGYQRLKEAHRWSVSQVAEECGVTQPTVSRSLALLSLPAEVIALVEDRSIKPAVGYELSKLEDPGLCLSLAEEAIEFAWNRDTVAGHVKAINLEAGFAAKRAKAEPAPALKLWDVMDADLVIFTMVAFDEADALKLARQDRVYGKRPLLALPHVSASETQRRVSILEVENQAEDWHDRSVYHLDLDAEVCKRLIHFGTRTIGQLQSSIERGHLPSVASAANPGGSLNLANLAVSIADAVRQYVEDEEDWIGPNSKLQPEPEPVAIEKPVVRPFEGWEGRHLNEDPKLSMQAIETARLAGVVTFGMLRHVFAKDPVGRKFGKAAPPLARALARASGQEEVGSYSAFRTDLGDIYLKIETPEPEATAPPVAPPVAPLSPAPRRLERIYCFARGVVTFEANDARADLWHALFAAEEAVGRIKAEIAERDGEFALPAWYVVSALETGKQLYVVEAEDLDDAKDLVKTVDPADQAVDIAPIAPAEWAELGPWVRTWKRSDLIPDDPHVVRLA